MSMIGLPWYSTVKNLPVNERNVGLTPGLGRSPGGGKWQPTPILLPGESHGHWTLVGYNPWGHKRVRHDLVTKQHKDASLILGTAGT